MSTNESTIRRRSTQRERVFEVMLEAGEPLTPQEILDRAQGDLPSLGIATVYRNLKVFQEEGRVKLVQIPGETPRYETFSGSHHHYFSCRNCGRAFPLDRCAEGLKAMCPKGFQLEDHEIILYGRCKECSGK